MAEIQLPPLQISTFQWGTGDLVDEEGNVLKKVLTLSLPPPFYPKVQLLFDPEKASELAAHLEGRKLVTATQMPNGPVVKHDLRVTP